ncbi:dynein light chain roadblock-type 2-like [Aplysia californica]|uniref:Dynein light chain roadblock n=1 Tax=Aplysia californica TaxID=6500 RepID=A0ABM1VY18_APLCA|nr:dynein light chain roadblock-type 2-like [Aplysia californica]
MSVEVEETLKRLGSHTGVVGIIVVNSEGIPIKSTLDNATTVHYASHLHNLTAKARCTLREIDPMNELKLLRVRSHDNEIVCALEREFLLIVIQRDHRY